MLEEGVGDLKYKVPTLLVLNKKDLIKPGEIAKRIEVRYLLIVRLFIVYSCYGPLLILVRQSISDLCQLVQLLCGIHQLLVLAVIIGIGQKNV